MGLLRGTGRRAGRGAGLAAAARQSYTGLAVGTQGVANGSPISHPGSMGAILSLLEKGGRETENGRKSESI